MSLTALCRLSTLLPDAAVRPVEAAIRAGRGIFNMLGVVRIKSAKAFAGRARFSPQSSLSLYRRAQMSNCLSWKCNRPAVQKVSCGPAVKHACLVIKSRLEEGEVFGC
jgi:hypothetical protein